MKKDVWFRYLSVLCLIAFIILLIVYYSWFVNKTGRTELSNLFYLVAIATTGAVGVCGGLFSIYKVIYEVRRDRHNREHQNSVLSKNHTVLAPPSHMVGRESELKDLHNALKKGTNVIAISGKAGVGKSALARRFAHSLESQFPDFRWEIDLKGINKVTALDSNAVIRGILELLFEGAKLPDDSSKLRSIYLNCTRTQKILLLLDNVSDINQIQPLIPDKGSVVIITSRNPIGIPGAFCMPLNVFDFKEAYSLLHSIAPKFMKGKKSKDELVRLFEQCFWLPFYIRLAASVLEKSRDCSVLEYLGQHTDIFQQLKGKVNVEEPELSKQALFEIAYRMLGTELALQFRALGVFTAPFDQKAAAAVWQYSDKARLRSLGQLVDLNLVQYDRHLKLYSLHDLTRLFAEEKLLRNPLEAKQALERYAGHYLQVGGMAEDTYRQGGENVLKGILLFRWIWPHLQSAWERVSGKVQGWPSPDGSDEWLGRFPLVFPNVLDLHLPARQRIPLLELSAESFLKIGDRQGEGTALGNLGNAYADLGEVRKAIGYYEQALTIAREIGDRRGEGNHLGNLGNTYRNLGEVQKAIGYYEKALSIARETGDRRGEGADLGNLGNAYGDLGEVQKAIGYYEQALTIHKEIGDRRGEGNRLGNLGNAYSDLGEVQKAIGYYEQALTIDQEIGDRRGEGADLGNLGNAYADLGEVQKAIGYTEQALTVAREIGDRRGEGNRLGNLGTAYYSMGELQKAIGYTEQALAIHKEIGDRRGEGNRLGNLGLAYADLGEVQKAIGYYQRALAIAQEIGDRRGEGNHLYNLGLVYEDQGDIQQAIDCTAKALQIYSAIASPNAENARKRLEELKAKAGVQPPSG